MDCLKDELSISTFEKIVDQLSRDWKGNEDWLEEFVVRLNNQYNKVRDELIEHNATWTEHDYNGRLAHHYHEISRLFYELYIKQQLDVKSVTLWLEKCLDVLGEIPSCQVTTETSALSSDASALLEKLEELEGVLTKQRAKLKSRNEEYISLSAVLGDFTGSESLLACIKQSGLTEHWAKKLQNITIARTIAFLEDSFTHRNHGNSLVTSNILLSLGNAYHTVGVPILGKRYHSIAQDLLKSSLTSNNACKDEKENIKNLIRERIKQGYSLNRVLTSLEEIYSQPLSSIDEGYISRKYVSICFRQYIDETVEFLKDIAPNYDNNLKIQKILANLRCSESLLLISYPLDQAVCFELLKKNFNLLEREDQLKWMNKLKRECFEVMADYVNASKKELQFLEVFTDFLGLTKETKLLEDKLSLHQLCVGDVPLGKIIERVLGLEDDEFPGLKPVKSATALLKNKTSLVYSDEFRDFIIEYLKPPTIRKVELDGRHVLEVCGVKVVLSEIVKDGLFKEIFNDKHCDEVRIISSNIVHADEDLNRDQWHGKNLVVMTKKLYIHGSINWDVSGEDSTCVYTSNAGTDTEGNGKKGDDGKAGESGGNVLILVETVLNPQNLTIISQGGKGSDGQEGGSGRDGEEGKGITKSIFESKFPLVAKFQTIFRLKNIKTTLESINNEANITYKWYERPVSEVSKWVPFASLYKNVVMTESVCLEKNFDNIIHDLDHNIEYPMDQHNHFNGNIFVQAVTHDGNELEFCFQRPRLTVNSQAYFLFKGAHGKPGNKGGEPGLGGQGGFGGEVAVRNPKDLTMTFKIFSKCSPGTDGQNGKGGRYGLHGKNGCDMGYLDYSISEFFNSKWPKWYGEDGNSKVELTYHAIESSERVWSPYRRYKKYDSKFVGMSSSGLRHNEKCRQHDERVNVSDNLERRSDAKATMKKTISQANILSQYQVSGEKASLANLFSEINKTNSEIEQSMAVIKTVKLQVNTQTEFTRCSHYKRKKKSKSAKGLNRPRIWETPVNEYEYLKVKSTPLKAWAALGSIFLSMCELIPYMEVFEQVWGSIQSDESQTIREMLLKKYRIATFSEIAQKLSVTNEPYKVAKIDAFKALKYLRMEKYTCEISNPELGTLSQFLFINTQEEREKIVHYIGYSLEDKFENELLTVFRTFVLTLGKSSNPSNKVKSCFDEYNSFFQKEERGLIVFPESLQRLDRIHSKNTEIFEDFKLFVKQEGCLSFPCVQLLALIFDVNIRVYKDSGNPYNPLYLEANHNPMPRQTGNRDKPLHILVRSGKCMSMQPDWSYVELDKKREMDGNRLGTIMRAVMKLEKRIELDTYLAKQEFLLKSYLDTEDESKSLSYESKMERTRIINEIVKYFDDVEQHVALGLRLGKLSNYVPGNFVESIHARFSLEGRHVSEQELSCLVNAVLFSAAQMNVNCNIYLWIVIAYPQNQWINQVLLIDVETCFRKALSATLRLKWEGYLNNIAHKRVLIQLREKLVECEMTPDLEQCIEDILFMLCEIPEEFEGYDLGLTEWPYALKEKYWSHKLKEIREWKDPIELSTFSYYVLSIENTHGTQVVNLLLNSIAFRKHEITPGLLLTIFSRLYDEVWGLTMKELNTLNASKSVEAWVDVMEKKFSSDGKDRNLRRLVELIEFNANTSDDIIKILPSIENRLDIIETNKALNSSDLINAEKEHQRIRDYSESDISKWVKAFKEALEKTEDDVSKVKSNIDDIWVEMLDVVDTAIFLKRGFRLRNTQKLAVMILLKNDKSVLAQVATGEGKSLIVVAVSIIEALIGGKVDIITSSSVLAKRDATNNQDIYSTFGIKVSHNCSEDIEVRKSSYSGNQVVYGDLADFQRDYLLHEFYNINVLGDRAFQTVVVDEVDSMLLDKGNNMLYLSHGIPGLDKLESLYLFIWKSINRPCGDRDSILHSMNVKSIHEAVNYDLYGTIEKRDIKALDVKMTNQQASYIWDSMNNYNIVDDRSRLKIEQVDRGKIETLLSPQFTQYTDRLCYLLKECIARDRQINVPNYLKPFVDIHLDKWITNAIRAFFMKSGEDYVVDVDRTGTSADRNPNITIIDQDTGTDQSNSQWDEALHQFLQLKHGCKVSLLSLKAVFISNVSYFKQYHKLCGLTGTLGSQGERKLLNGVHNVDFVTIPTAKPKQFHECTPKICLSETEWKNSVKAVALDFINKKNRSVLVICESVNDVESLHHVFGGKRASNVHTYARDYEEFDITQSKEELGPGYVIIATNLAGRGTDIKINEELKRNGGLHVILAYLPKNARIEQQAFGRAARCGEIGSGQLIISVINRRESKMMNMKNKRDAEELERISEIKSFYQNNIKIEEMCFAKFKKQYTQLKKSIHNANSSIPESVIKLAFASNFDLTDVVASAKDSTKGLLGLDTSKVPKEVEEILLNSCVNKWAFWLDENGKLIKDWTNLTSQKALHASLDQFLSRMSDFKCSEQDWAAWLGNDPVSLVQLAKYFHQNKNYNSAIALLDKVIYMEPQFSEGAHYYKALSLGCKIDWESQPSDDHLDVKNMKAELRTASRLFEKWGNDVMMNAAIIEKMKEENQRSLIQVNAYEEQQKNIANLCRFFSSSIDDILGHSVTPESFCTWNLKDHKADKVYNLLLQEGILTRPKVSFQNISKNDLETLSCEYDISISTLSNFLTKRNGDSIMSFKSFKNDLKKEIPLPSKEAFWKELVRKKIFSDEVKYVIVNLDKLDEVDPSLLDSFNDGGANADLTKYSLEQCDNYMFYNEEQIKEQTKNTYVFLKGNFIERVGINRYTALKDSKVLAFNRQCKYNLETLKLASIVKPKVLMIQDLTALTSKNEAAAIIKTLCSSNVLSPLESSEEFEVLVSSFDGITLANEKVEDLLKKHAGDPGLQLSRYDSFSFSDLTRNRITEKDAEDIVQELTKQRVIEKIPKTCQYRLIIHYTKIDDICLNSPVYENVVKSVLKMSFLYRIALQKIVSQLEEGTPPRLHLKTKPHMDFLWSLHDYKVLSPSLVRSGVSEKDVQNVLPTKFDKANFKSMVESYGVLHENDLEELVDLLINKEWLVPQGVGTTKMTIQKDKGKRKPLDKSKKTIAKIVNDIFDLSDKLTITSIHQSLDRMKSMLKAFDVPSFGFKPLTKALAEGDFSMIQELSRFMLCGLGELVVLNEKAYTFKFWLNVTCVIIMGLCQIAVGTIIDIYSVGACTFLGNAFMSEGISDIMFAIGAMRTGYFSWSDYGRHKIESLALTLLTAGVGSVWAKGSKFSRVGQKMNPTGLAMGTRKITEVAGAEALKNVNASITKEVLKQVALKTIESAAFAGANVAVDIAVDNCLQSLSKSISSEILENIDNAVQNHPISSKLENVFRVMGESSGRAMIHDLTAQHFKETTEWDSIFSWATKITSSVCRGLAEAAAKKQSAGNSTRVDMAFLMIAKSAVWLQRIENLREIHNMTAKMLDGLADEIDNKLSEQKSTEEKFDEDRYTQFKLDIVNSWRSEIQTRSANIIGQQIVSPLIKDGAHWLLRHAGRQVKSFYRQYKDNKLFQELLARKNQYQIDIERAQSVETREIITKEYHTNLLMLASETRNPKLFADIIRENVPMDLTCLHAFAAALPNIMHAQGVEDSIKIVVEREGDDVNQEFVVEGTNSEARVIRLRITDNHFELLGTNGEVVPLSSNEHDANVNNCLYRAIVEKLDLNMSDEQFRTSIASTIEEHPDIQNIIKQRWHRYGLLLRLHGGRTHPYQCPGKWEFDSKRDIDMLDYRTINGERVFADEENSNEELNKHLQKAYNETLKKINEIVTGKSEVDGWAKVKLLNISRILPEHFEPTMYDTVFIEGGFGQVKTAYYPVEMETVITVKEGKNSIKYVVSINMDVPSPDQNGPQGPHLGYEIKLYRPDEERAFFKSEAPKTVVGHCLIGAKGNEQLPRRAEMVSEVPGLFYVQGRRYEQVPENQRVDTNDLIRLPHTRLFYGMNRIGSRLQRCYGQGSTRNRSFPSSSF